jgi:acetyl-CoA C-acetyltransferase
MREVAIVGAGMTQFAEHFSLGIKDLLPMAFAECAASVDKGLDVGDIQAAWFGELSTTDGFPSGILADTCGLLDVPVTHVENACATGNDAVRNAVMGIASGFYDVVLVMGADKVRESASKDTFWEWAGMTRDMAWDYPLGLVAPANFALHVARYSTRPWWWSRSGSMTARRRATARRRCCSPPRTWRTGTRTGQCGSAASGSALTGSCTSTSGT